MSTETTTTQLNIPGPTSEEQQLTQLQIQLGESQLSAIKKQTALQEQLVSELGPLQELQAAEAERALAEAERTGPIREELLNLALEDIRRGGAATPEEIRLIEEAGAAGLAGGEINIERFETEALGKLREELAPSLGLRPSDTPILDRGGVVAAEALRQKGTLSAAIQQSGATSRLNFPLARSQLLQAGVGAQQTLQESVRQFQEQLRTQAFINRLNLTGQTAGLGLGLATGFQPNLAGLSGVLGGLRGGTQTQTTSQGFFPTLFQGISALGGGLEGVGAVTRPSTASSRDVKTDKRILDEEDIAEKVIDLPVESWRYIGDEKEHVGPYAEDFTEAFGLGDSKTIDLRDLAGVTMAAVKGLGKKIERLEGKGFGLMKEAA